MSIRLQKEDKPHLVSLDTMKVGEVGIIKEVDNKEYLNVLLLRTTKQCLLIGKRPYVTDTLGFGDGENGSVKVKIVPKGTILVIE